MTRANMHITLSNGRKIRCVTDSSSAPEQGYIVEQLILPLLDLSDAQQELALIEEHCTMKERRINATYRYVINLRQKSVAFYEENYDYGKGRFFKGADLCQRYDSYLQMIRI